MSSAKKPLATLETVSFQRKIWKKSKKAPLHEQYVTPLSFHIDAVEKSKVFLGNCYKDRKFGMAKEAYLRQSYVDILKQIDAQVDKSIQDIEKGTAAIVRGSSGIGKSTFLAFVLANFAPIFENIAVLYAPKLAKKPGGEVDLEGLSCVFWLNEGGVDEAKSGDEVFVHGSEDRKEGSYVELREELRKALPRLDLVVMDGCTIPFDLQNFTGAVIAAASPSMFVKNLADQFPTSNSFYTMPPVEEEEALVMGDIVGVDKDVVKDNLRHVRGVARYLFKPGAAKKKVEDALGSVSARSIMKMISIQSSAEREEALGVHALVLWMVDDVNYAAEPNFAMVSRYAERLVATKLAKEKMEDLKEAMKSLSPLSGAEGYAGALFEAYAIRKLQNGCKLKMRSLEEDGRKLEVQIPKMTVDPVVVEGNKLSSNKVKYASVRVPAARKTFSPRLL